MAVELDGTRKVNRAVNAPFDYHEQTKHFPNRFARSLGYLDWGNQPDPFRRFKGSPLQLLPFPASDTSPPFDAVYTPLSQSVRPPDLAALGEFLECALGIAAWKEYAGTRWELRCNPSSGNLHPTEGYLIVGPTPGLSDMPGVYHYAPLEHGLELRAAFSQQVWTHLVAQFPPGTFFAGLSTIFWREAWKYGERAYRYCNHDAGHALAALAYSAAALGWRAIQLSAISDAQAATLLGTDREDDFEETESEHADMILAVTPADHAAPVPLELPAMAIKGVDEARWLGQASRLSRQHVEWTIIDRTADACEKPFTTVPPFPRLAREPGLILPGGPSARSIFMQRRSAQAMDGRSVVERGTFYHMLKRLMPRPNRVPWSSVPREPRIHLAFLVHRVQGLTPGLYVLVRDAAEEAALRGAMNPRFRWARAPECPESLPFYFLLDGDFREAAAQLCCDQEIARDGAFCVAMLARFRASLLERGPWAYPRLFWEAGMAGQVLYLEAEAAGIRGTGIGCYFDEATHQFLGLRGDEYQSLYHFTVGGAIEDPKLTTLPPYSEERRNLP